MAGLVHERLLERGRHPRVALAHREVLVGHQLRLHDDPGLVVDRLHLEAERDHGTLGERDDPPGADQHALAGR
jgi:hypothetical protein